MTPPATPQPQDPTVEQIDAALKAWNIEGACLQDGEEGEDLNFLCMAAALRAYDSAAIQSLREERDALQRCLNAVERMDEAASILEIERNDARHDRDSTLATVARMEEALWQDICDMELALARSYDDLPTYAERTLESAIEGAKQALEAT